METKKISQEAYSLFAMGKLKSTSGMQKNAVDTGFEKVMDSSMQKTAASDAKEFGTPVQDAKKDSVEKTQTNKVSQDKENAERNSSIRQNSADSKTESQKPSKESVDVDGNVTEEETMPAAVLVPIIAGNLSEKTEEIPEEVTTVLGQLIVQAVSEVLQRPGEEVEKLLEENGITAVDLLQPENLKEFLLSAKDETDMTAFLVNADLKESYDILTEAFSTILPEDLEEKGVTLSEEELAQVMKALSEPESMGVQKQASEKEPLPGSSLQTEEDGKEIQVSVEVSRSSQEEAEEESPQAELMSKPDQTEKGHGVEKPVESFVQHLEQSVTTNVEGTTVTERVVQYREIVNQVVEQIKVVIKPESTNLSMQLNPEQLGRVALHMTMKNGQMTASFFVQNEMAKEALESNMQTLRENLSAQGLKVESVEVSVSDFSLSERGEMEYGQDAQAGGQQKQPQGKQRRLLRMEELEGAKELTEEEEEAKSRMEAAGSTVDFTA